MFVTPAKGYLVVKPADEEKDTHGIHMPASLDKKTPQSGEVINGPEDLVGETVFFRELLPVEVTHEGEPHLIISEDSVIAYLS